MFRPLLSTIFFNQLAPASGWQFPEGLRIPQHPLSAGDGDVDIISGNQFRGLDTFAHLPYVNCLSDEETKDSKYDIAILGAPFDTAVTGRPGARYGPSGIRSGSNQKAWGWDIISGKNPFESWATLVDCGDAPLTVLDNNYALKQLDKAHRVISGRRASNSTISSVPRILTLGGDHTTTLSALRSTAHHWGGVSVVHFDSHIDTWDPAVLGGGISDYAGLNHGTFLHIAHEEGLVLNTSIHAGIRAPGVRKKGDLRNDKRCGFEIITARDLDKLGSQGVISKIEERVGSSGVYISVDIDVLDPAFAPATGTPEAGGWSTRELLTVLDGLSTLNVIGADVVEVSPPFDTHGEITSLAAAEVAVSLISLMVGQPVRSDKDVDTASTAGIGLAAET